MKLEQRMQQPIRIVVDSNVIISAFHFGGEPARVISTSLDRRVRLYLSLFILREVEIVLRRKFAWKNDRLRRAKRVLEKQAKIIQPADRVTAARDEKDNRILECALSAHADYLISGDNDLLSLKTIERTQIVTPAQFLAILRKKDKT